MTYHYVKSRKKTYRFYGSGKKETLMKKKDVRKWNMGGE